MAIPSYQLLFKPLLEFARDYGVFHANTSIELKKYFISYFNLTQEELDDKAGVFDSGLAQLNNRRTWALAFLKSSKLIEQPSRGYYQITSRGLELLAQNLPVINNQNIKELYPDVMETAFWNPKLRKIQDTKDESEESYSSDLTPDEQLSKIVEQKKISTYSEIKEQLKKTSPQAFEKLVVKLLIAMGYGTEEFSRVTQYSNDGGIDGVIQADQLGFRKIYVQAKRYIDGTVGRVEIQNFVGAMRQVTEGIFITTSKFSNTVREYLKDVPHKQIILIDGDELVKLMYKFNQGVSTKEIVEFKAIDGDYFEELEG